jgi:glycosyltransferase involved in cell wall biosynthesis
VPVGDAQAIADAIVFLVIDPVRRREMGLAGYHRVVAEFSWPTAIETVQDFYKTVLEEDCRVGRA